MIIISDYDVSKLGIASELVKKAEDKRVLLLSDALYLLSSEMCDLVNNMEVMGATFLALEADVKRRGIDAEKHFIKTSYEGLVNQLLEQKTGIINL